MSNSTFSNVKYPTSSFRFLSVGNVRQFTVEQDKMAVGDDSGDRGFMRLPTLCSLAVFVYGTLKQRCLHKLIMRFFSQMCPSILGI